MDALPVDLAWVDDELDAAIREWRQGRIEPAIEALTACTEPQRRELRARVLGQVAARRVERLQSVAEGSRHQETWLLLGSALARRAWATRGPGYTHRTEELRLWEYQRQQAAAIEALRRAAYLRPDDAVPHSLLLDCFATDDAEPEAEAEFRAATDRCPALYMAHVYRLESLSPDWHGSQAPMLAFAGDVVARTPDGDPRLAVLAMAHIALLVRQLHRTPRPLRQHRARAYLSGERLADVNEAAKRLLRGHGEHPYAMDAHQQFAYLFITGRRLEKASAHLRLGGDRPAASPWSLDGDPAAVFRAARLAFGMTARC